MSPAMMNFFHEFAAAAQALEQLPVVEQQLSEAKAQAEEYRQTVASRESHIIDLKNEIDNLNAKLRSVEAERDDASFRVLEVQDTFNKVFSAAGSLMNAAKSVDAILNPPKPEPAPQPEPTPESVFSVESVPTLPGVDIPMPTNVSSEPPSAPMAQGQSEPHPTEALQTTPPIVPTEVGSTVPPLASDQPSNVAAVLEPVTANPSAGVSQSPKPYSGRNWSEVDPRVWDKNEWLANGGTEEGWAA